MKTVYYERIINGAQDFAPPRLHDGLLGAFDVELILDNVDDLGDGMVGIYKYTHSIRCQLSFAHTLIENEVFTSGIFRPDNEEFGIVKLTSIKYD
jgi:hypothetical protein